MHHKPVPQAQRVGINYVPRTAIKS
jgi:hypothetical protein